MVGAYSESPFSSINLPFTLANFRALLAEGARPDARYTHQQIKDWADRFWGRYTFPVDPRADVPPEIKAVAGLAQEIEAQWDMYLANTYSLQELQSLDFSSIRLPHAWFADWLAQLDQLLATDSE